MIENPALSDFPVRPQKAVGESVDGWCWRIYVSNGHAVPQEVRSSLKAKRSVRDLSTNTLLADLLGTDLLQNIEAKETGLLEGWDPENSLQWHTWSKTIRICPLCIRTIGYHCLLWQLPLVAACPVHSCKLTDSCLSCGQKFSWMTLSYGWHCTCGARAGELPTTSAPLWQVQLTRMLAKAVDAQVADDVREISANTLSGAPPYRTRDLYEVLWWCLKVRRGMTEHERVCYNLAKTWPVVKRRGARMEPGAWEVSLIDGNARTWSAKARSILNWYLRSKAISHTRFKVAGFAHLVPVVLVDPQGWACFERITAFAEELHEGTNPLSAGICFYLQQAMGAHSAGIPGLPTICFHPRLSATQRQERMAELALWWEAFAKEIPPLIEADQLIYGPAWKEPNQFWRYNYRAPGIPLLNIFFSAAHLHLPPEELGALIRRWHLPPGLRNPKDVLLEVGGYVGKLLEVEIAFVHKLIDVSVFRFITVFSTAACDE